MKFSNTSKDKDVNVDLLVSVINDVRFSGSKNFSITTQIRMHYE
jgi:hypothetical protein